MSIARTCDTILSNDNCNHIWIKNSTRKKSLNDFNLFAISFLYGDTDKDIHASKHPISKENHVHKNIHHTSKHRHIPMSNKYSGDLANQFMTGGSTRIANAAITHRSITDSKTITPCHHTAHCHVIDSTINAIITTRSCTIKIPILIFPKMVSFSRLSVRSLIIIIVLLNERAKPIYQAVKRSYQRNLDRIYASQHVITICIHHTTKALLPCSLIVEILNSSPTMKSNNAIQRWAKSSIKLHPWSTSAPPTMPRATGHKRIHAIRYPIIAGCLSIFSTQETITTTTKIALIWVISVWWEKISTAWSTFAKKDIVETIQTKLPTHKVYMK